MDDDPWFNLIMKILMFTTAHVAAVHKVKGHYERM